MKNIKHLTTVCIQNIHNLNLSKHKLHTFSTDSSFEELKNELENFYGLPVITIRAKEMLHNIHFLIDYPITDVELSSNRVYGFLISERCKAFLTGATEIINVGWLMIYHKEKTLNKIKD